MRSVFIISDLHLGGAYPVPPDPKKRGFRLCTHADAIVNFVEQRTKDAKLGTTEIVLNGDTVDFLAEVDQAGAGKATTWASFTADPLTAVAKFRAIVARDKAVFDSFGPFLDAGGRLTVLLGNHDVELSLPAVRRELRKALGVKPHHDFEFLFDGEAYIVGDALIEHGNRYDAWNQIDYDALRHIRSFQSRGLPVPPEYAFTPPAGSDMVTSVINAVKEQYAFVDLLKPETAAVAPILLALEPGYRTRIATIAMLFDRKLSHGLVTATTPAFGGDVRSDEDMDTIPGMDTASPAGAGSRGKPKPARKAGSKQDEGLKDALRSALGGEADAFLQDIDAQIAEIDPSSQLGRDVSAGDVASQIFGFAALLFGRTSQPYQKRLPALLKAMRGLQNTDTFNPDKETATEYFDAAVALARDGGVRHVVFGHTHLAKKVPLDDGFYFNSGTWADVLQFPADILTSQADATVTLESFIESMKAGDFDKWTPFRPTYVRLDIGENGKVARADLVRFEQAKSP